MLLAESKALSPSPAEEEACTMMESNFTILDPPLTTLTKKVYLYRPDQSPESPGLNLFGLLTVNVTDLYLHDWPYLRIKSSEQVLVFACAGEQRLLVTSMRELRMMMANLRLNIYLSPRVANEY